MYRQRSTSSGDINLIVLIQKNIVFSIQFSLSNQFLLLILKLFLISTYLKMFKLM